MKATLLGLLLGLPGAARAQPNHLAYFIPAGYRVLPNGQATGDLNGDGRPDVALALGPVAEQAASLSHAPAAAGAVAHGGGRLPAGCPVASGACLPPLQRQPRRLRPV